MSEYSMRLDGITTKVEGSYASDPTPVVGSDTIRLKDRVWNNLTLSYAYPNLRENTTNTSILPLAAGAKKGWMATLDFGMELTGYGGAYTATHLPGGHALLRCCGLGQAVDLSGGSETVTYTMANGSHTSTTIWAYAGGYLFKINGCRGNLVWTIEPGTLGELRFQIQGIVASSANQAFPTFSFAGAQSQVPQPNVGVALTISSWTPARVSAVLDLGANVVQRASANQAGGVEFAISHFDPHFTVTCESELVATYDAYTIAKPASTAVPTNQTIDMTVGATQYNKINLDVNNATLEDIGHSDLDGFSGWELSYRLSHMDIVYD